MRLLRGTALALALLAAGCGDEDEPVGPGDEPPITVESPIEGNTVTSPVTVSGTASVFEGTVQISVLDEAGDEVGRTFTTATAGAPDRGDFSTDVEFEVTSEQEGVIHVFSEDVASPGEGETAVPPSVEVAVTLAP